MSHTNSRMLTLVATAVALMFAGPARSDDVNCPNVFGWTEGFPGLAATNAAFPINDTEDPKAPDCNFQQWSWEAFVWATATTPNGVPRFLELPSLDDLTITEPRTLGKRQLALATRSVLRHGEPGFKEGTGAIVQADGGMLVAPNGYPVYASVHMTPSYLKVARQNLVINGGYMHPGVDYFSPGDAVFKATWLRLAPGESPPDGAYVTEAEVPVLARVSTPGGTTVQPEADGKTTTVNVALVGLHVVGYTINHPEFLWGTFEHKMNTPRTPDGEEPSEPSSKGYTFYQANTALDQINCENIPQAYNPPQTCQRIKSYLSFDETTQTFSPSNNAWLLNETGGENNPTGAANIKAVNQAAQTYLKTSTRLNPQLANYDLIGTLWLPPNYYVKGQDGSLPKDLQANSQGSINLANTTAETYEQVSWKAKQPVSQIQNCFMCHNPDVFATGLPALPSRLIAISHVLEYGTSYAVPNKIVLPAGLPPLDPSATGDPR
jgi:hypothetical protein